MNGKEEMELNWEKRTGSECHVNIQALHSCQERRTPVYHTFLFLTEASPPSTHTTRLLFKTGYKHQTIQICLYTYYDWTYLFVVKVLELGHHTDSTATASLCTLTVHMRTIVVEMHTSSTAINDMLS